MPVTLAQAQQNATDDVDLAVIDEFRTNSLMDLITFDDVVNPVGGGGTLTYGYRRLAELGTAAFRAINAEYAPTEVSTTRHSVDLKPLGGSFQVDRVLSRVGPAASGEVALQMSQKIRATQAEFGNAVINGDSSADEDSFDGLSKALAGSTTEVTTTIDWSATMGEAQAFAVLDALDELLALLDGAPGAIITNKRAIAKIRSAARRTSMYTREPGPRDTYVEAYGGARLIDAGKRAGTNADVIPVRSGGLTEMYAVRFGLDAFHGVSMAGAPLVQTWLPDFTKAGAVKTGEVEMGPVAVVLKRTKAAAVARSVKVSA
ncbi:MAG: phage capsid protein [Salana multivorans]|uniref:major capsid protein n=1 Tax=Salana multivorans TaxID=120377 RepID=UPI00095BDC54|nr:phage capsid protein [Salana multivorans]MBN8883477.1 phage capsid protein [Salana multivorans]OJX98666.1 MAG: phage capsid protein [Micrococcales bacterium 73-15]